VALRGSCCKIQPALLDAIQPPAIPGAGTTGNLFHVSHGEVLTRLVWAGFALGP
jgi:hypothetical protein